MVDLEEIDDFSKQVYQEIQQSLDDRQNTGSRKKQFLFKRVVSQNRKRYQDKDFDLDLAQISQKVFAMGLPAEGMASFYRNSKIDVIKYFGKFHSGKVKFFNLCDDKFIDTNKTSFPIDKTLLNA